MTPTELQAQLRSLSLPQLSHFGMESPADSVAVFRELRRREEAGKALKTQVSRAIVALDYGPHSTEMEKPLEPMSPCGRCDVASGILRSALSALDGSR